MKHLLYDGSFPGLLSVFFTLLKENNYRKDEQFKIFPRHRYKEDLFHSSKEISTESEKAELVYDFLKKKFSNVSLKRIYYSFLSEIDGIEDDIYKYVLLGVKLGKRVDSFFGNETIFRVCDISRKVGAERHRLVGLLRFKKLMGGIFYATFEPDYNIITLIAPHFANRLSDQKWLIHDQKRKLAVIYQDGEWYLIEFKKNLEAEKAVDEDFYQELWKGFFSSIAIESRKNPRLQKQYMPVRYWKHLIEKN